MKHIICLVDGTWVTAFGRNSLNAYSNIFKINLLLKTKDKNGNQQIAFYVPGMGSRSSRMGKLIGGVGRGLADLVEETYVHICSNYEKGDKIYLFGFSRGAVVARFVASLISRDGLYRPEYVDKFRTNFDLEFRGNIKSEISRTSKGKWSRRTKEVNGDIVQKDVEIEFLGVFDTVYGRTALSDKVLKKFENSDRNVPKRVNHAIQILAADECRLRFHPHIWSGFEGDSDGRTLEQIWMPGVHGDIGGIYVADFLGNMALFTMIDRVLHHTKLHFEKIGDILQSSESIMKPYTLEDGNEIVINGYSSLRDYYLKARGRPRQYGHTDTSQRISNLHRHLNSVGAQNHSGIINRKFAQGEYKTIGGYEVDRLARTINAERLGVFELPM